MVEEHNGRLAGQSALIKTEHAADAEPAGDVAALRENDDGGLAIFESVKKSAGLGFAKGYVGTMLLANTLLGGSGMLGIPHALSVSGWALGSGLLVFFGCTSAFGCHLLHCSARRIGKAPCSFCSVANAVAPKWAWLIDGAVAIKCFGVATSYLIIVGDLVPDAVVYFGLATPNPNGAISEGLLRRLCLIVGFGIAAPLATMRNLSSLKFTATGSVLIVAWTVVLILLFFVQAGPSFNPCQILEHTETPVVNATEAVASLVNGELAQFGERLVKFAVRDGADTLPLPCEEAGFEAIGEDTSEGNMLPLGKVLSVFIFSFTCHQNIFAICNEVSDASRKRIDGIILGAYSMSAFAFAAAAIMGYWTYGDAIEPDVLKNYPQSGIVEMTRILYSLVAIFSFPVQIHPSRISCMNLWHTFSPIAGTSEEMQRTDTVRFWVVTCILLAGSLTVTMLVTDLGVILGIVGATGSTMVSYILPGIVYIRTFRHRHFKRYLGMAQLAAGFVIMPSCLVMIFL